MNRPPVANAGGEKTITLPMDLMVFDGSASKDDKGIVSYEWMRDDSSLAAGVGGFSSQTSVGCFQGK